METRRSIIVAIAALWGLVLMGNQAFGMGENEIPIFKEICIRIKKIEDKDKLEKACQQNNHRLIDKSSQLERSYLIEIPPHDDAKKFFEDYNKLSFVEFACLSDSSIGGITQRQPNLQNFDLTKLRVDDDLGRAVGVVNHTTPLRPIHVPPMHPIHQEWHKPW